MWNLAFVDPFASSVSPKSVVILLKAVSSINSKNETRTPFINKIPKNTFHGSLITHKDYHFAKNYIKIG